MTDWMNIYNQTGDDERFGITIGISDYKRLRFKIIVIGDHLVGKSSIVRRFDENEFSEVAVATMGVEFCIRTIMLDQCMIRLDIWDTAGQERFRAIVSSYYKGADGVIIVFDVTHRSTFENITAWRMKEIQNLNKSNALMILVGNRCDSQDRREVSYLEVKEYADGLGIPYIETSARDGTNVEQLFVAIAANILLKKEKQILCTDVKSKPFFPAIKLFWK